MDNYALATLVIFTVAVVLFLTNRMRADIVALLTLVSLGATGVLTPQEAFAGFSRSAVITIVTIFVLAHGLFMTGASERVGSWLVRAAGESERRLIVLVMLSGAFLSLFMNNIAAASVLLPAVSGAAARKGVNPSRLLMPLAFATILGGMATLFTTTNIVISGLLREHDLAGFGVLDFAPVGVPVVIVGILYMTFWGRHLLPAQSAGERFATPQNADLTDVYRLDERLFRARVPAGSYLNGTSLMRSTFRETYNLNVVALERNGQVMLAPPPNVVFQVGDVITLQGILDDFREKDVEPFLEILPARTFQERDLESPDIVVVETVLSPRSSLLGKTLRDVNFREKFGFMALAIWRGGRPYRRGMATMPLEFGDALLLQGPRARLRVLRAEPDLIMLSEELEPYQIARPRKVWISTAIMAGAILIAATNLLPTAEAMLAGALLMVLTNCLTADEAYAAIEWKAVFLVGGMLPLGVALTKTGLASLLASALVQFVGPYGTTALLAGLFIIGTLLTQVINGPAVAAMLGPLAIEAAQQLHADPRGMALGVALATSMAFLTPLGHPVNVLVMGPGGYKFSDYFKVGAPLTVFVTAVILILLPLVWRL